MRKVWKKIISSVLLSAMLMTSFVMLPVSAVELSPLPDATDDYTSGVFIAARTVDEAGNAVDPLSYNRGDTVIFELAAYNKELNRLAVDSFVYSLYDDAHGNTAYKEGFVEADPETGVGLVKVVAMDQPGMLRITADIGDSEGKLLRAYRTGYSKNMLQGAVIIDAVNVTTVNQEPEDFDKFWEDSLALLPDAKLVGLKEIEGNSGFKAYEVYVDCYGLTSDTKTGDTFTAGYLTVPTGAAQKSLKIRAIYEGQGLSPLTPTYTDGYITFRCLAHSVDLAALAAFVPETSSKSEYYREFLNLAEDDKSVWGEATYGMSPTVNADKEKVYYRHMLLRDYQAVEFMTNYFSSEGVASEYNGIDISSWKGLWNGKDVMVSGGSQGGFQAIGTAALHPDVTYLSASIPWLCDIGAGTTKAPSGTLIGSSNRPAYAAGLDYVDSAFLAKRITCKTDIDAGLGDPTCPPAGVVAMYNNLTKGKSAKDGPYTMKLTQNMVHGWTVYSDKNTNAFLKTYSVGTIQGAFGTDAYSYELDGSVLNIVSASNAAVLKADKALVAFATENAESIKTIEIEGKFDYITSLEPVLKKLNRLETIKIDVKTTVIGDGFTNALANAANLASVGHVEFDAMGTAIADTGTFKRGVVNLSGFDSICDGILSGARTVKEVVLADANIPAKAFAKAVSLETVKVGTVTAATVAADAFEGTSGVKIVVDDEASKTVVEAALAASSITNVTVTVGETTEVIGDKTGAAGATANWKIKGSTLILSGNGVVSKLEGLEEADKATINNIVISEGITAISNNVIVGFELDKVSLKGITLPVADDGVFGVQSAEFVIYVTPDATVGDTLYGYTVVVDGGTAGDLNGDGEINATDSVILAQILANWDIEYNVSAADCNGDGEVNAVDTVLLAQFIAGWDVQLGATASGGDVEIPGGDLLD